MPLWTIFTKWPAPARAAVQITVLGGIGGALLAWGARRCLDSGCDALENRIQVPDDLVFSANHQTKATLQPHHSATSAAIDIMDTFALERLRALKIVAVSSCYRHR